MNRLTTLATAATLANIYILLGHLPEVMKCIHHSLYDSICQDAHSDSSVPYLSFYHYTRREERRGLSHFLCPLVHCNSRGMYPSGESPPVDLYF